MASLSPQQISALRELATVWKDLDFCVIGATALKCQTALPRQTNDVDISLAVDFAKYPNGPESLLGWRRDPNFEPRWFSPDGVKVDIVPSGMGEREITWPKSGVTMSVVGMQLAISSRIHVEDGGLRVPVAPVPLVVVLKMAAYLDRPFERERDLEDLAWLLEKYLADDEDRRFSDPVLDAGVADEVVSAFLLGLDVGAAVAGAKNEHELVGRFIDKAMDEDDRQATLDKIARFAPSSSERTPEKAAERIGAFRKGFVSSHGG